MLGTLLVTFIFWTAAVLIAYTYVGYPLLLWLFTYRRRRPKPPELDTPALPFVSVIVAMHNEEAVIKSKLNNCAAFDYPAGSIEFIFGSDGSDDCTESLIQAHARPNVRLHRFAGRRGKSAVLNDLVQQSRGEILVFTDTNTVLDQQAVRQLVRHFQDPCVGGVCGQLVLLRPHTSTSRIVADEANYWNFEYLIKRLEGDLGMLVAANGAIYAIRRALFQPLPIMRSVADDLLVASAVLGQHATMVYDSAAMAYEVSLGDTRLELMRKIRVGENSYNSIPHLVRLLAPGRGRVAWMLWSHKIIRWTVPFLLLVLILISAVSWSMPFYRACLLVQFAAYASALAGYWLDGRRKLPAWLSIPYYFAGTNLALLLGFFRSLSRSTTGAWTRVGR